MQWMGELGLAVTEDRLLNVADSSPLQPRIKISFGDAHKARRVQHCSLVAIEKVPQERKCLIHSSRSLKVATLLQNVVLVGVSVCRLPFRTASGAMLTSAQLILDMDLGAGYLGLVATRRARRHHARAGTAPPVACPERIGSPLRALFSAIQSGSQPSSSGLVFYSARRGRILAHSCAQRF